jgi:hypothetical protein
MQRTHVVLIFLGLCYLLFPTNNSTIDAYYYAASVKWDANLFSSHHLLYNLVGWLVNHIIPIDPLLLMKLINGLAALGSVWVLGKILASFSEKIDPAPWMILVGLSFGVWRFATENETYIIPILLSLFGSYFLARGSRYLLVAGLFAALACLFHQLHFFWWIGLLVTILFSGSSKLKNGFLFATPAIIVPAAYIAVLLLYEGQSFSIENLMQLVFRDFYAGRVESTLKWTHFALFGINTVRTFLQIHGNMLFMVSKSLLLVIPAVIAVYFLFKSLASGFFKQLGKVAPGALRNGHIVILILHLAYAFYSEGNAEFMVMMPFLLAIIIGKPVVDQAPFYYLALSLFIWNFAYGIFPAWNYDLHQHDKTIAKVESNPIDIFVLEHQVHIDNIVLYRTGEKPSNTAKAPHDLMILEGSTAALSERLQYARGAVYTDCVGADAALDRKVILQTGINEGFFKHSVLEVVDSTKTLMGMRRMYLVRQYLP